MKTADHSPRFGSQERELVLRTAALLVRDEDDAEDVTQDAMLTAFERRARFRGIDHFRSWLNRIATTTAVLHLRRSRRESAHVERADTDVLAGVPAYAPTPEDQLIRDQEVARVRALLAVSG